ncbi:heterokaryon incompatibility, partial [Clohesyomyces aquaticus]
DTLPRHNYEAVSYKWGNSELPSHIICEGKKLSITRNCKAALEQFSSVKNRLLWVDSICINQNDVQERNEQVSLMAIIYSSADRTLAWLG